MDKAITNKLLSDRRVVAEIQRHLWIESEKAGYDIGFDKAKEDWLKNFSKAWMQYHMPTTALEVKKKAVQKTEKAKVASKKAVKVRRRRAKSYVGE